MIASKSQLDDGSVPAADPCPSLPDLSQRDQILLAAYVKSRFNLAAFAAAARLTPKQLADFAASPAIQAHIDAMMGFARKSLYLRAIQARHSAINELEALAKDAEDKVEKRRAASQLLRATSSSICGSIAHPPAEAGGVGSEPPEQEEPPLPRPYKVPAPSFTARQVRDLLVNALVARGGTGPGADLGATRARAVATFAAFADHEAEINDEPVPTDDLEECAEMLDASPVGSLANSHHAIPHEPPAVSDTRAVFRCTIARFPDNDARTRDHHVTIELTRKPDSRVPNCWLLASMTVGPPVGHAPPAPCIPPPQPPPASPPNTS